MQIENLRRKADFYEHIAPEWVRTVWPRIESLNHFLKSNRCALLEQGGIARLGRDWFIDCERFPKAAKAILSQYRVESGRVR